MSEPEDSIEMGLSNLLAMIVLLNKQVEVLKAKVISLIGSFDQE